MPHPMPSTDIPRRDATGKLLLVEDEMTLAGPVMRGLEEEGYTVDLAQDGLDGEARALNETYDVLIIDWRLPRLDGRTLIERLRKQGYTRPILMLTALRDVDHKVAGLDAGADDYLTKPFSFEELMARLRALLRCHPAPAPLPADLRPVHLHTGPLEIDTARRQVFYKQTPLPLRTKEYLLLELLLRHQGRVLSRSVIAERIWGSVYDVTDNAIDVTVSGLRQKLSAADPVQGGVTVETVRGVGYYLRVNPASEGS
ncbi:MAG: response regulator transcription factor [Rhodothermales bacterium]